MVPNPSFISQRSDSSDQAGEERIYKTLLASIRRPEIGEKVPLRYVPGERDIVSEGVGFETAMIVLYMIAGSMAMWLGVVQYL